MSKEIRLLILVIHLLSVGVKIFLRSTIKVFLVLQTFSKLNALHIHKDAIPPVLLYFCKELMCLSDSCVLQAADCR